MGAGLPGDDVGGFTIAIAGQARSHKGTASGVAYLTTTLPFIIEMWPGKVQKKL